ncbi:MAG: hypothetical protein ACPGFA_14505, partial [Pikeienuella sp.]
AEKAARRLAPEYDLKTITQEHRRLAMSFAESDMDRFSEPTVLDQRMATRMVELIDAYQDKMIDEQTYKLAIKRIEQVRAATYLHPQFEDKRPFAAPPPKISEAAKAQAYEAARVAEPKVQAQFFYGNPNAVRALCPKLTTPEVEALAANLRRDVGAMNATGETQHFTPEMKQLFAEKAHLGMPVKDMTPAQASQALHRLRDRHGRAGVEALAKVGKLDIEGLYGVRIGLGPAKLVKGEMKDLLAKANKHRKLPKVLEKVLEKTRVLGLSR